MPTPKSGYFLKDGTKVPSVTTIIGPYGDPGGLMHWAWALGKEGKDYRQARDKAADIGTIAHAAIEAHCKGEPFEFVGEPDVVDKARKAFENFKTWFDGSNLIATHTEVGLVSEKYRFGGTLDAILFGKKRTLGDWKSSNKTGPKMLMQVAAYGKLWAEHHPNEPLDGGYDLLRVDKKNGDFKHMHWDELDRAWDAFLHLRALYDINKELKARAA